MARAGRSKAAGPMSYFPTAPTFSIPPPSPSRRSDRAFSGPLGVSIIPKEARHKKSGGAEPSSPKISCMGQIKSRKKKSEKGKGRVLGSCFKGLFRRRVRPGEEEEAERRRAAPLDIPAAAPPLGLMRKYQSGRETLKGFEWRKAVGGESGEEEEEDVFIPHSAPILVGGGAVATEPKKEVNLWRRRDMKPPIPLQDVTQIFEGILTLAIMLGTRFSDEIVETMAPNLPLTYSVVEAENGVTFKLVTVFIGMSIHGTCGQVQDALDAKS